MRASPLRPMRCARRASVVVVAVLLGAACTDDPTNAGGLTAPAVPAPVEWRLPELPAGGDCPVTARSDPPRPAVQLSEMTGDGPVRVVGPDDAATMRAGPADGSPSRDFAGRDWGGTKLLVAFAPGPIEETRVVGRQLDGTGGLGFGMARDPDSALVLRARASTDPVAVATTWSSYPIAIRVRHGGCYGLQFESHSGVQTIVFRVVEERRPR